MGGSQSYEEKEFELIIVGFSFAGQKLLNELIQLNKKIKVTLVEKNEFFNFICTSMKTIIDPQQFQKLNEPYKEIINKLNNIKQNKNISITLQQGWLDEVIENEQKIKVKLKDNSFIELDYDVLVLATGSSLKMPWKQPYEISYSYEEMNKIVIEQHQKLREAESVLILGGGSTGVETAGFVKHAFPNKKVTIVQRGDRLISSYNSQKASQMILDHLTKLKITILLNTNSDQQLLDQYQFVIDCTGFKYEGPPKYFKNSAQLLKCLDPYSNQIYVNKYFQVSSVNPLLINKNKGNEKVFKNIFSIGDVCLSQANEIKSIVSMYTYIKQVAENIILVGNKQDANKEGPLVTPIMQMLPIGPEVGMMVINNMIKMDEGVSIKKDEIEGNHMGVLRGDQAEIQKAIKKDGQMGFIFNCFDTCCCCCCPFSNYSTKDQRKELLDRYRNQFK